MFFSTSLLTALLVACAAASPVASFDNGSTALLPRNGGKSLIGYRTVSEKEGRSINGIGWLYWDDEKMPAGSTRSGQFGVGKSLAHAAGELATLQLGTSYFCYVLADTTAFAAAHKVHLPVPAPDLDWTEANTVKAIKANPATSSWDTNKVLRFGQCGNVEELLIPVQMLGFSSKAGGPGPLGLEAHCYASLKAMQGAMRKAGIEATAVNYESFKPVGKRGLGLEARVNSKVCQMF